MPSKNSKIFPSDKVILLMMISIFIGGIWIGFFWLWSLVLTIIFFSSFCGFVAYMSEKGWVVSEDDFFPNIPIMILLMLCFLLVGGFVLQHQPNKDNINVDSTVER